MPRRPKARDDRDYDSTQLREASHGHALHRDYSAHFWRWSFVRRFINVSHDVLEIGCGQDRPLAKILTRNTKPYVNKYVGVDINKLKPSNHERTTFIGEFNFVERHRELQKQYPAGFDFIVHLEVIEHMHVDLGAKMLKACYTMLKPGGTMLMSTPCYDGVRHAANHIHEYTVPELQKVVEKAGFTVVRRFGTFMNIKHIGRDLPTAQGVDSEKLRDAVQTVRRGLEQYFDADAISNIFGCLYPDHSRNNVWICKRGV